MSDSNLDVILFELNPRWNRADSRSLHADWSFEVSNNGLIIECFSDSGETNHLLLTPNETEKLIRFIQSQIE
jgi:hypothetical protein